MHQSCDIYAITKTNKHTNKKPTTTKKKQEKKPVLCIWFLSEHTDKVLDALPDGLKEMPSFWKMQHPQDTSEE